MQKVVGNSELARVRGHSSAARILANPATKIVHGVAFRGFAIGDFDALRADTRSYALSPLSWRINSYADSRLYRRFEFLRV